MKHPNEGVTRFWGGLPGFEIGFDRPTPMRAWLHATTAIMGTLAWNVR